MGVSLLQKYSKPFSMSYIYPKSPVFPCYEAFIAESDVVDKLTNVALNGTLKNRCLCIFDTLSSNNEEFKLHEMQQQLQWRLY
uniref:Uncharacterized protein n=1 Tax=Solanum lycopersicum TaxID=4081 RepID=A0A3Q7ISB2_SOLLC